MDLFVALANKGDTSHWYYTGKSSRVQLKKKGRVTFEEKKVVVDSVEIRATKSER